MTIDRIVFAVAGFMVLLSVTLTVVIHQYWLGLAVFVGLNMFQAAFSGWCPLAILLKKLGTIPGKAFS